MSKRGALSARIPCRCCGPRTRWTLASGSRCGRSLPLPAFLAPSCAASPTTRNGARRNTSSACFQWPRPKRRCARSAPPRCQRSSAFCCGRWPVATSTQSPQTSSAKHTRTPDISLSCSQPSDLKNSPLAATDLARGVVSKLKASALLASRPRRPHAQSSWSWNRPSKKGGKGLFRTSRRERNETRVGKS